MLAAEYGCNSLKEVTLRPSFVPLEKSQFMLSSLCGLIFLTVGRYLKSESTSLRISWRCSRIQISPLTPYMAVSDNTFFVGLVYHSTANFVVSYSSANISGS